MSKRSSGSAFWYLRTTDPETKKEQWYLFPGPQGCYPQKTLADARTEAVRLRSIRDVEGISPPAPCAPSRSPKGRSRPRRLLQRPLGCSPSGTDPEAAQAGLATIHKGLAQQTAEMNDEQLKGDHLP